MSTIIKLKLALIRRDKRAQPRIRMSSEAIQDYAEQMSNRARFPAVDVFYDENVDQYHLADGFHRCAAAEAAGLTEINAKIHKGGLRQAILFSVGSNDAHGLRRSNEDKRHAIKRLLDDPDWSQRSDRWISRACGVHHDTVGRLRASTGGNRQSDARRGADGRTIHTANIGANQPRTEPPRTVTEPIDPKSVPEGPAFGGDARTAQPPVTSSGCPIDTPRAESTAVVEPAIPRCPQCGYQDTGDRL